MKNFNQWLNSGEYRTEIDTVLTNIVRCSETAESEAETAGIFEREIYYLVRSKTGIAYSFKKEKKVNGLCHTFGSLAKRTSGRGRLDAVVNQLIIEYKHHSKLKSTQDISLAIKQVEDYLFALWKSEKYKYDAILTDGVRIAYFSFTGDNVNHTMLKPLTVEDVDTIIKAIISNETKKFEPSNIVQDFSISPMSASSSKTIAQILYGLLTNHICSKSNMLYNEWKGLMHLSVEDNGKSLDIEKRQRDLSAIFNSTIDNAELEYMGLFALQTTYAIIVKLIACKVVDRLNFNTETSEYHDLLLLPSDKLKLFFQKMEDGYSYSSMNIRNFLEGDFFSWYTDDNQWCEEFYAEIKKIIESIDKYTVFSLDVVYEPMDVFKDLYMSIIPQSVRHSMGEYFTPEWLADGVIEQAIMRRNGEEWKAIDPCCGSGIFLICLIRKIVGSKSPRNMTPEERHSLLSSILERVNGIDINPLSVLSARVSYYIALSKLGIVKDVEIPIYLGDSAIIPSQCVLDDIECFSYVINNLKCSAIEIILPKRLVAQKDFSQMMNRLQALVKTDKADVLYNVIVSSLTEKEKSSQQLLQHLRSLSESLVFLHANEWDGIWIRIATNFMMIARLHSYDLIVGNPPWVKWEHLPAAYTRKIKEFCDVRHIFCNDGGMFGGAQLNICALIANVTAANWLERHGILAFLMPDSLMSQNSYEEFRNFYIDASKKRRLYLQALDRWKAPLRPFKVGQKSVSQDFNTYYYGYDFVDYSHGVAVREISKRKDVQDNVINGCQTFGEACAYLSIDSSLAKQLSPKSTAFTYVSNRFDFSKIIGQTAYYYRTGVESTPFEVFKLLGMGSSTKQGHYRFKNKILKTSRYKVDDIPIDGWDFPTDLIYPMVEGPNVKPFEFSCGNNYHIVPYKQNDTSKPISFETLVAEQQNLAIYFANHKHILDKQSEKSKTMHRGEEFYALSKIGSYTFAPYIVAARDNSKFCAAVIKPTLTPWGETKHSICVKHTIIISQGRDGHFITEDEAHYINGILNSSIVVEYIHNTFKTNGFSLNKSNLFLPQFIANDALFQKIVTLSKEATSNTKRRDHIKDELTIAYLAICEKYNRKHNIYEKPIEYYDIAAEPLEHYGSIDVLLQNNKEKSDKLVLMYAIGPSARKRTQESGNIALGIKEQDMGKAVLDAYRNVKYIVFHYWKNEEATLFELTERVEIVEESEIPNDFLVRQSKDAKLYLLIRYDHTNYVKNKALNVLKVQRTKERRYLPFVTTITSITDIL